MEALVGFVVGYWFGSREGKEGVQKTLDAVTSIMESDRFQSLVATAFSVGEGFKSSLSKSVGGVIETAMGAGSGRRYPHAVGR